MYIWKTSANSGPMNQNPDERELFSYYTFSRKRQTTARTLSEEPDVPGRPASWSLAASIHSAHLFGLLRLHFWTVNPEAQNGDPEQCKVSCRLQTLDLVRQILNYLGNVFFFFNNKSWTKTCFPIPTHITRTIKQAGRPHPWGSPHQLTEALLCTRI